MKKRNNHIIKVLAAALAIAVVGGMNMIPAVSDAIGTNTSVSAVTYSSPVVTVGDYQYVLYSDGTANVVGYTGTKNMSTTSVGMPTVVYAKDVSTTWTYINYKSSYNITKMQAGIFNGCKFKTLSLPRYLQSISGGSLMKATATLAVPIIQVHMRSTTRAILLCMLIRQILSCMSADSALQQGAFRLHLTE